MAEARIRLCGRMSSDGFETYSPRVRHVLRRVVGRPASCVRDDLLPLGRVFDIGDLACSELLCQDP